MSASDACPIEKPPSPLPALHRCAISTAPDSFGPAYSVQISHQYGLGMPWGFLPSSLSSSIDAPLRICRRTGRSERNSIRLRPVAELKPANLQLLPRQYPPIRLFVLFSSLLRAAPAPAVCRVRHSDDLIEPVPPAQRRGRVTLNDIHVLSAHQSPSRNTKLQQ